MIYVAMSERGRWVKIGYHKTIDCWKRIAELQCGNPNLIVLDFSVDGTLRQEQAIHALLVDAVRMEGVAQPPNEWYPGTSPVVKAFIACLRSYGSTTATSMLIERVAKRAATTSVSAGVGWAYADRMNSSGRFRRDALDADVFTEREVDHFLTNRGITRSEARKIIRSIKLFQHAMSESLDAPTMATVNDTDHPVRVSMREASR
jgi:hypothetical protein